MYVCSYGGVGKSESTNPGTYIRAIPFSHSKEECNKDEIAEWEQNERELSGLRQTLGEVSSATPCECRSSEGQYV